MSESSKHTVQLQYFRDQYIKGTTTVCQTAVHTQYNCSKSDSRTYTVQIQYISQQYTHNKTTVCQRVVNTQYNYNISEIST
jgi:hypothetical protein